MSAYKIGYVCLVVICQKISVCVLFLLIKRLLWHAGKLHHYFYHNGHELPLVLENSNRDSHQVANHILKIILKDILCYHSIDIRHQSYYDNVNASAALDRITGCSPAK